jgi:hypothetical protein
MNKFLEFFQGASGEMSSKRLGYLATIPASILGTIWICNKLIDSGKAELAVDVWNSFFVFSAVLGGFVSIEVIQSLICAWKGKTIIQKEEVKNVENNT